MVHITVTAQHHPYRLKSCALRLLQCTHSYTQTEEGLLHLNRQLGLDKRRTQYNKADWAEEGL